MSPDEMQEMLDRRFPEGAQVATAWLDGGASIYDNDLPTRITPRVEVTGMSEDQQVLLRVIDVFGNHPGWFGVSRVEEYDGGTDGVVLYDGTVQAWRVTSHLEPGAKEAVRKAVDADPGMLGWGEGVR